MPLAAKGLGLKGDRHSIKIWNGEEERFLSFMPFIIRAFSPNFLHGSAIRPRPASVKKAFKVSKYIFYIFLSDVTTIAVLTFPAR